MVADLDRNILKIILTCIVSSNSTHSVKAVDPQNKNMNNNKMQKWTYFTICQKLQTHAVYLIIIDGTSKQHKRMPQKVFLSKFERIRQT